MVSSEKNEKFSPIEFAKVMIISFVILFFFSFIYLKIPSYNIESLFVLIGISALISGAYLVADDKVRYLFMSPVIIFLVHILFINESGNFNTQFILGITFSAFIALISIRLKFLTVSGSLTTFILAGFLFGLGGIKWSVPILTFFILSSVLSKIRKKHNAEIELCFEKSGVRDHWQVLANGGLGFIWIIAYTYTSNELFYLMNIASLAAVCADTWATEIGTYKKNITYNILNFHPVEQGRSGGVSVPGTFGSILGSTAIAFSGLAWTELGTFEYFLIIISAGLFGSIVDSIIGATIQYQLKCNVCKKITERKIHCGVNTDYHSGLVFVNNDLVNFFSAIAAVVFIIFVIYPY